VPGMPGTSVFYAHTFMAGSGGSVTFSTSNVATPAVAGWTQVIYRDSNCSGALDGAEGGAPIAGAVAVNAGDTVCIVVQDNIPAAAPFNAQNVISVTSTFNATSTITRTDTTTVGSALGAGLTLAKTVRNVTQGGAVGTANAARPNDVLEYMVTYTNTSNGPITAVVITDSTPAFTQYLAASCGAPLPAAVASCVVTGQPAVNGSGSIVWTLTGSLNPGQSGTVSFTVRVQP
jgi:mucin-19